MIAPRAMSGSRTASGPGRLRTTSRRLLDARAGRSLVAARIARAADAATRTVIGAAVRGRRAGRCDRARSRRGALGAAQQARRRLDDRGPRAAERWTLDAPGAGSTLELRRASPRRSTSSGAASLAERPGCTATTQLCEVRGAPRSPARGRAVEGVGAAHARAGATGGRRRGRFADCRARRTGTLLTRRRGARRRGARRTATSWSRRTCVAARAETPRCCSRRCGSRPSTARTALPRKAGLELFRPGDELPARASAGEAVCGTTAGAGGVHARDRLLPLVARGRAGAGAATSSSRAPMSDAAPARSAR